MMSEEVLKLFEDKVWESPAWKEVEACLESINASHLRDMMEVSGCCMVVNCSSRIVTFF